MAVRSVLVLCLVTASVPSVAFAYNPDLGRRENGSWLTDVVTVPKTVPRSDYMECTNERDRVTEDAASLQIALDGVRFDRTADRVLVGGSSLLVGLILGLMAKKP